VPGVLERLSLIETELKPNSGGSIKDKVTKLAEDVEALKQQLQPLAEVWE